MQCIEALESQSSGFAGDEDSVKIGVENDTEAAVRLLKIPFLPTLVLLSCTPQNLSPFSL